MKIFWDLSKSKCIPGTDKKGLWSREISPILENSQRNSPLWAVGRSIIQGGGGREVREISQIRQHRFCLLRKSNSPVQQKIHTDILCKGFVFYIKTRNSWSIGNVLCHNYSCMVIMPCRMLCGGEMSYLSYILQCCIFCCNLCFLMHPVFIAWQIFRTTNICFL